MKIKGLKPLGDRVLIKPIFEEEKSKGGILLPDTVSKEKPQMGEVLAVGPGGTDKEGKVVPMTVKVGDKVVYAKYSGTDIKGDDEEEYLILSEKDIESLVYSKESKYSFKIKGKADKVKFVLNSKLALGVK